LRGRGLHGTVTLLPDATALFAGENRETIPTSASPTARSSARRISSTATEAPPRVPALTKAPLRVAYKTHFDVTVDGRRHRLIAIIRSDHNTHSLTTGDRYVKLAFKVKGDPRRGELRIPSRSGSRSGSSNAGRARLPLSRSSGSQPARCDSDRAVRPARRGQVFLSKGPKNLSPPGATGFWTRTPLCVQTTQSFLPGPVWTTSACG
jgi:hypothetical protein